MLLISCLVVPTLICVYNFLDPTGAIFLGGLVPEQYFTLPVHLVLLTVQTFLITSSIFGAVTVGLIFIIYSVYLYYFISREFRIGRKKYACEISFREQRSIQVMYRSFQVLHLQFFESCHVGLILLVSNGIIMVSIIYLCFVLLRYWDNIEIIMKAPLVIAVFVLVGYWSIILQFGCLLHVSGNKVLRSWKQNDWGSQLEKKCMRKFMRSYKPILFSYGKQFVIGRVCILSFYRGVVRGTCRVLLTTK